MIKSKLIISLLLIIGLNNTITAQLPQNVLVGYWQTWNSGSAPFIKLSNVDSRYNVINISFIAATSGDVNTLALSSLYTVDYSQSQLITDIAAARQVGKIVCLSVGGANGSFRLATTTDKNTFVTKMKQYIGTFGVDGIDIDLEDASYVCFSGGTISAPTDAHAVNTISAIQELLAWYQTTYGKKMILTMAPETVYVTGGLSSWAVSNACGGSYLPIIEGLRDDIDLIMVQLYNSGSMYDLNTVERFQGTVDFIVSQTEAFIRGFTAKSGLGTYSGLPASKIVVALPACSTASGYVSPANVKSAIDYLRGNGTKPGTYTLIQSGGYPNLRGMMTWSINSDNSTCSGNSYATNYESIFSTSTNISNQNKTNSFVSIIPNITSDKVLVEIINSGGKTISMQLTDMLGKVYYKNDFMLTSDKEQIPLNLESLPVGTYMATVISGAIYQSVKVMKQ